MNKKIFFLEAAKSIRSSLKKAQWWALVQDEVKGRLDSLLKNFDNLGIPFKEAYIAAFKYHHIVRMLSNKALKAKTPGVLFGGNLTEETYQCAKEPTKSLLALDDWFDPTEADVQACIAICNHLERLEKQFERVNHQNIFDHLIPEDKNGN